MKIHISTKMCKGSIIVWSNIFWADVNCKCPNQNVCRNLGVCQSQVGTGRNAGVCVGTMPSGICCPPPANCICPCLPPRISAPCPTCPIPLTTTTVQPTTEEDTFEPIKDPCMPLRAPTPHSSHSPCGCCCALVPSSVCECQCCPDRELCPCEMPNKIGVLTWILIGLAVLLVVLACVCCVPHLLVFLQSRRTRSIMTTPRTTPCS